MNTTYSHASKQYASGDPEHRVPESQKYGGARYGQSDKPPSPVDTNAGVPVRTRKRSSAERPMEDIQSLPPQSKMGKSTRTVRRGRKSVHGWLVVTRMAFCRLGLLTNPSSSCFCA